MKKFAFVSDFDGTLTYRDFYHIIIDKYLKDWGVKFYNEWKATKKINVEFLNRIFGSVNLSEKELYDEILQIPLDENAADFIKKVVDKGGSFFILSAGTSYYIDILLASKNLMHVKVVSMQGVYKNGGIEILPDPKSQYYSDIFGVDKGKFVRELKKEYETVFYAGDSEPDLEAAKSSDIAFAKNDLQTLLRAANHSFIAVDNFTQVEEYLVQKGWL